MLGAGIHDGDVLVVDRAVDPAPGKVVVAAVGGEFTVKRLAARAGRVLLLPENPDYPELDVTEREDFELFGVVRHVIHSL
jgi:DNA polymerase V